MNSREVIFGSRVKLAGVLTYPDEMDGDTPGVVLLHGFTSNRDEAPIYGHNETMFQRVTKRLSAAGIASLRFDFRGHGESQGAFENITVQTLLEDVLAAVEFLGAAPRIGRGKIGLLGQSMGGLLTAYAAGSTEQVKAAALWNAPSNALYTLCLTMGVAKITEALERGSVTFSWENAGLFTLRREFFASLFTHSPLVSVSKFHGPLFVVVGTNDPYTFPEPETGKAFIHSHPGDHKMLVLDSDHTFNISTGELGSLDKAMGETIDFFRKAFLSSER